MNRAELRVGQNIRYRPPDHAETTVGGFVVKVGPRKVAVRLPHRRHVGDDFRGRPRWRRWWATVWVDAAELEPWAL